MYSVERVEFQYRVVTPRIWWRIANVSEKTTPRKLRVEEMILNM